MLGVSMSSPAGFASVLTHGLALLDLCGPVWFERNYNCPSVLNLRKSRSLASGPPPAAINSATTFRPNRRRGLRVQCGGRRQVASVARSGAVVSEEFSDTSIMPPLHLPRGPAWRVGTTSLLWLSKSRRRGSCRVVPPTCCLCPRPKLDPVGIGG